MFWVVGAEEEIETPAGSFKAVPVRGTGAPQADGSAEVMTWWYARGVGVVQMAMGRVDKNDERTEFVLPLEKFSMPKASKRAPFPTFSFLP